MLHSILQSQEQLQRRAFVDRLRAVGAVSPQTALPLERLPLIPDEEFRYLVERGDVREGAPGTFYRFERSARPMRRLLIVILLWLVLFLVPMVLFNLYS